MMIEGFRVYTDRFRQVETGLAYVLLFEDGSRLSGFDIACRRFLPFYFELLMMGQGVSFEPFIGRFDLLNSAAHCRNP